MILEVLPAAKGDCLMIHTQTAEGPGLVLIDGGPAGVWEDSLLPRLEQLRQKRIDEGMIGDDDPLVIDLVIVSHVDDDHINGVIDLLEAMKDRLGMRPIFKINDLWHNSFDRILGNDQTGELLALTQFGAASTATLVEEAGEGPPTDHAKILASVKQGDDLRRLACALDIPVNDAFGGKLIQTVPGQKVARQVAGVNFVVLGPLEPELKKLQEDFDEWLERQPAGQRTEAAMLADLDDESVANLSSIVLLAQMDGRSILLTGDARSDKILRGLEDNGECEAGEGLAVGILKMPHHGSIRNINAEFLRRVTSSNYVFSGNGEHGNPDRETFELLFSTRPGRAKTLYLTYGLGEIDLERHRTYDKERNKKLRKGEQVDPWSDSQHGLAAILSPPPAGVELEEHDGSLMQIEPPVLP